MRYRTVVNLIYHFNFFIQHSRTYLIFLAFLLFNVLNFFERVLNFTAKLDITDSRENYETRKRSDTDEHSMVL